MSAIIKNYKIKEVFIGETPLPIEEDKKTYLYKIIVKNMDNNKKTNFHYYGSPYNYNKGKIFLDYNELVFAFQCFLSIAIAYHKKQTKDENDKRIYRKAMRLTDKNIYLFMDWLKDSEGFIVLLNNIVKNNH